MLHKSLMDRKFQGCIEGVLREFQGYFKEVLRMIQDDSKFLVCFKDVSGVC